MKKRFAMSVALVAALSMVGAPAAFAQDDAAAEEPPPPPFPSLNDMGAYDYHEVVADKTIEEWTHQMALWMNGSKDHDVISTGDCTAGQGDDVFFLQNTWVGEVLILDCVIPADTPILVSPGGGFGFNTEDDETAESLDQMGRTFSQLFSDPEIILDGQHVQVGPAAWIHKEPFEFTIPEDNIWDYPAPEETLAGYSGWYVMLQPLEPGPHSIILSDDFANPVRDENGDTHYVDGTAYAVYDITVE